MINIHFRKFDFDKDLKRLFEYMTTEENQILFSHGFQVYDIQMFGRWIAEKFSRNEYHDFFMIENNQNKTMGFVFSYAFYGNDAHCKYTLCLYEEYQHYGYGAIASIKFIEYLFKRYSLKRIYVSVFDYNHNSLQCNLKGGFEEVGLLPEYRYCGGDYYSLHILTISRERFYDKINKFINKL